MNCKPGDLAVVVRSTVGNEGRIFKCLRLADPSEFPFVFSGPVWHIDTEVNVLIAGAYKKRVALCEDAVLRPIRDNPGADETLTWAGLPQPSKETA